MKYLIASVILSLVFVAELTGQFNKEHYELSLDPTLPINQNHPYIEYFSQQDDEYIAWLYVTNVVNMENTAKHKKSAAVIDTQNGNNSLVFTLTGKDEIRYDTLRNSIHDFRESGHEKRSFVEKFLGNFISNDDIDFLQNLDGDLPKGAMIWREDKNWGLKFGVLVPDHDCMVEILIRDTQGRTLTTIVDKPLRKGWNNFKWKRGHHPRGVYNLSISINGETITQNFKS